MSGGIESSCLAYWKRPKLCITVDYGQVCAEAEIETAAEIAKKLKLTHRVIRVPIERKFGLSAPNPGLDSRSPEFWPFRNQFLATVAAMHLLGENVEEIWFGSVRSDDRFLDGSQLFFRRLSAVLSCQEGGLKVLAPAKKLSSEELISISKTPRSILGATFSCHRSNVPCGDCPGCIKQRELLYSH